MKQTKQQKTRVSNRYRKTIYFGKELYNEIDTMARTLGIPFSTTIRVILETGLSFANGIERSLKNGTK